MLSLQRPYAAVEEAGMSSRYASIAEDNWRTDAPDQYALIKNKPAFFRELGDEAQRQIDEATYASKPVEGETFLQRASRIAQAQAVAEEIVGRELLAPPQTDQPIEYLDPASGIPLPPTEKQDDVELREALTDFRDAAAEVVPMGT